MDSSCHDEDSFLSLTSLLKGYASIKYDRIIGSVDQLTQKQLDEIISEVMNDEKSWSRVKYFFGKDLTAENKKSRFIRTIISIGAPLHVNGIRYKNAGDRDKDQRAYVSKWVYKIRRTLNNKDLGDIKTHVISRSMILDLFIKTIISDSLYILFSIGFVMIYITFHLGSLFLSIFSSIFVMLTFPLTVLVYY